MVVTVRIPPAGTKILLKSLHVAAQGNVETKKGQIDWPHFLPQ